jgi:hypothetical protein
MHPRRTERHTFLSSQASQPQDFEIHLGVIFFGSPIKIGSAVIRTVSAADLKLPLLLFVRSLHLPQRIRRKSDYILYL